MKLKTEGKMLKDGEVIPKDAMCYGMRTDNTIGWSLPGGVAGRKWKKYSLQSPSIVLVKR